MNPLTQADPPRSSPASEAPSFARGLGLFDSVMVVVGVMIGSGIFIVSAEMAREIGSAGWLLVAWAFAGALTIAGALSYGELAAMMPRAGGMYIYLREAFSPLWGFLYGWTLCTVIQTGTIAAVAIAFARFSGVLFPWISESHYLIAPIHISSGYAFSLSTAQLVAIALIAILTWTNSRGLEYGKIVQNVFTVAKTAALLALIVLGLTLGWNAAAVRDNFSHLWVARGVSPLAAGLDATTAFGLVRRDLRGSDGFAIFRGLLARHHVHGGRGEGSPAHSSAVARDRHEHRDRTLHAGERRVSSHAAAIGHSARAVRPRRHRGAANHLPHAGRRDDGRGHHGLDGRVRERAHSRGRAHLLRDVARRIILSRGRANSTKRAFRPCRS